MVRTILTRNNLTRLTFIAVASVVTPSWAVPVDSLTVPQALEAVEGNQGNSFPFGIGAQTIRYQQVYAATEFAAYDDPFLITQILFRPDRINGNPFSSTLANIQINLSTTSKPVNASAAPTANSGLSLVFAENIGADDTVVFSGALSLSSTDTPTGGAASPRIFDIVITLTTPFLYDPDLGNLLLDVRNFGGGATTSFDAQSTFGDSVSRVFSANANPALGVDDLSANSRDTMGLITQFTIQEIAEPATGLLAMAGATVLAIAGAYRRRRFSKDEAALPAIDRQTITRDSST